MTKRKFDLTIGSFPQKKKLKAQEDFNKDFVNAVRHDLFCAAKSLLENNNIDPESEDEEGNTALHWAVKNNNFEMVQMLAEYNIDFDARNFMDQRPLHIAIENNSVIMVDLLVKMGADLLMSNNGFTFLHHSASCDNSSPEMISWLIDSGLDVNDRSFSSKFTPLHIACTRGKFSIVLELLNHKNIEINPVRSGGFTPLHHASIKGYAGIAEALIKAGANINCVSKKGETPLFIAVDDGHVSVVELLLSRGADKTILPDGFSSLTDATNDKDIKILLSQHKEETALKPDIYNNESSDPTSVSMSLSDESQLSDDTGEINSDTLGDVMSNITHT